MKTGMVVSIGVATFVVGGFVGAGIMKGISSINLEKGLEELLYGDIEKKPRTYSEYYTNSKENQNEK